MQMFTIWIFKASKVTQSTYRKFIIEIANSQYVYPETFIWAEWVNTDLFAHFQELTSEHRVLADILFVLHRELL